MADAEPRQIRHDPTASSNVKPCGIAADRWRAAAPPPTYRRAGVGHGLPMRGGRELREVAAGRHQLGDIDREAALPIGMPLVDSRKIGLVQLPGRILQLDAGEERAGPGDEAHGGFQRGLLGRRRLADQFLVLQGVGQPPAVIGAGVALALRHVAIIEAERLAQVDIEPTPPAREGRQVVRVDHRDGALGIVRRRLEAAIVLALEPQHAVARGCPPP